MPHCVNITLAHRQRGFGLLQQALAIAVMVIVMILGLQLLLPLRGAAEQAQVQTVTGGLQAALGLETVRRILDGRNLDSLQSLDGSNPMLLLEEPPLNYSGTWNLMPEAEAARGRWYFDTTAGELLYTLRYPQYLCDAPAEKDTLRWRVSVRHHPDGQPRSVRLQPLAQHRWTCQH